MKTEGKDDEKTTIVKGGYDIDINILAVHRFESLLSSYEREQYFIENGLPPRGVTPENHDRAYENMLKTLQIIEERKLYDSIRVFKRGYLEKMPELVYKSGDKRYKSATEAILTEREKNKKELMQDNPEAFKDRIEKLKEKVGRTDNTVFLRKIEKLEDEFIEELDREEGR